MNDKQEMQELLNRSVQHVRKQGKPSVKFDNPLAGAACLYRSAQGLGCGAAPFINVYSVDMDDGEDAGAWSTTFTEHWRDSLDPLAVKHRGFVRHLQECHDDASHNRANFLAEYEAFIQRLASANGLDVPPTEAA